ncbi:MAG: DinB family protein [Chitinophagaceae bacterium]|nr:DinB family protein [Chitinophagaceae bacterium]
MKKIVFAVTLLFLFSFVSSVKDPITDEERNNAIAYFKETQKGVADEIKGLSETQLNWKPADSVWSAANCVEHIAISEKNLFDWYSGIMKAPATPEKRSEVKVSDDMVKRMLTNRSFKVKTREGFYPTGMAGSYALKLFNERREALIKYMSETKEDMRNRVAQTPLGMVDAYQLLLFLSAHTKRHTLQIAELKANPNFPKQ